jgi:CRISPR-associated protein Csd1
MTILQSLDGYYARMERRGEAEAPGFSREKISFAVVLAVDGSVVDVADLRVLSGKKMQPVLREVPAAVKRTAGIAPNRLWDKTSYVLGRTVGAGRRTADEHEAFKALHRDWLSGSNDQGLVALLRFLTHWTAERFDAPPFTQEMLDTNVVFRLDGEHGFLHDREAARRLLVSDHAALEEGSICLVTGRTGPIQRLHPTIKGVQDAQPSGAALVSFNLDAFTSYGKEQGDNAPTSKEAAFRYGAALNRMLDRGSRNRLSRTIGDATVAFWADTAGAIGEEAARSAEDLFFAAFEPAEAKDDDAQEAAKLRDALEAVAEGRPKDVSPTMERETRFHVLGLAPNAARLSVRYWLDDSFETFARRLLEHQQDLTIAPLPKGWSQKTPSLNRVLVKTTALQEKFDNIPDALAGEVMRAVLSGTRYPRTWLAVAIVRLRAGDDPSTGWHAAAIRAVLERDRRLTRGEDAANRGTEVPVSLAKDSKDEAYQLGRLFAALETAQRLALGRVNATIRDRYFGAASATPATVFPLLLRGVQNHIAKLRKDRKEGWIEREIGEIVDRLPERLPRSLKLDAQGRFAIGFYHQRQAQFAARPAVAATIEAQDNSKDEDEIDGSE